MEGQLKIKVFQDPWVPRPISFKPITTSFDNDLQVSELLKMDGTQDLEIMTHLFLLMDVQISLLYQ